MSFINDKTKEINCKVVYYGPPRCGKSTSLRYIYEQIKKGSKGEMISLSQSNDKTLYFDFVPLNLGKINDYTVRLHLYTVPGDVGYQQSRALISKGVDGLVFMADSQLEMMESNIQAFADLKEILGSEWGEIPCVFQYNKRDLKSAVPTKELSSYLNDGTFPEFETIATSGDGVFESFKMISKEVLKDLSTY
ncbi:MAG: GTPase domain-containing protein [Deltaproteobacteria bacterium]|jgi:mutual gliding-motility protein MglA|nr:GTPase domain-containing protein [Deltaproteobacteria bacterium]